MYVPEIQEVKSHLEELKQNGLIKEWELPYEEILTRLTAAIFFLTPVADDKLPEIWKALERHPRFTYRANEEKKLSQLAWQVEFNKDFVL